MLKCSYVWLGQFLGGRSALLLVATTSHIPLNTGLVLFGLSYFCVLPLLTLILMDIPEVSARYMGSAAGMFFCTAEIGGFVGPLMVGAIRDLTGGFLIGMCFLAGLSLTMSVLVLLLKVKSTAG